MSGEPLLRAREVAQLLDLSIDTVLDYFERGDLPGFRLAGVGGPVRFRLSEIEAWLESRRPATLLVDNVDAPAARERPGAGKGEDSSHAKRRLQPVRGD
jgi:excisionase family DNA binding protein